MIYAFELPYVQFAFFSRRFSPSAYACFACLQLLSALLGQAASIHTSAAPIDDVQNFVYVVIIRIIRSRRHSSTYFGCKCSLFAVAHVLFAFMHFRERVHCPHHGLLCVWTVSANRMIHVASSKCTHRRLFSHRCNPWWSANPIDHNAMNDGRASERACIELMSWLKANGRTFAEKRKLCGIAVDWNFAQTFFRRVVVAAVCVCGLVFRALWRYHIYVHGSAVKCNNLLSICSLFARI